MQRTLRYLVFRCSMRRIGTCTFKLAIEYLVGILSHLLHTQTHTHTDTHTHRHTHAQRHTDTHTHMDKQFCMTTRAFTSPPSPKCNAWPGAVDGLHIHGDWRFPNNDGIDPDSSTDVEIRHTRIDVADDGICPKVRVVCSLVCFEVYVCDCVRVCMWGGMRKKLTHTRTHARMHAHTHCQPLSLNLSLLPMANALRNPSTLVCRRRGAWARWRICTCTTAPFAARATPSSLAATRTKTCMTLSLTTLRLWIQTAGFPSNSAQTSACDPHICVRVPVSAFLLNQPPTSTSC